MRELQFLGQSADILKCYVAEKVVKYSVVSKII